MIEVSCPGCGGRLNIPETMSGKTGRCQNCSTVFTVPFPEASLVQASQDDFSFSTARYRPPVRRKSSRRDSSFCHSLGIASLVLGAITFPICWIPLIGAIGVPLSGLGVILGGFGVLLSIARSGAGIGFPIAGTAVSGLALTVAIGITAAIGGAINAMEENSRRANATNQTVVGQKQPPQTPTKTKSQTPAVAKAEKWASAKSAVQQGDIRVTITSVAVKKVAIEALGQPRETSEPFLAVGIEIKNMSSTKKASYETWQGRDFSFGRDFATLRDNFDNVLKRMDFGFGTEIAGAIKTSESLYPRKSLTDVLVFEPPIDATQSLRLELPADNFGGSGTHRFEIPKDMIER